MYHFLLKRYQNTMRGYHCYGIKATKHQVSVSLFW